MEFNRRMWLRGAAGFTLALPFLPSLLSPQEARAGTPSRRRFIALATEHGALRQSNMVPDAAKLGIQQEYAGHQIRCGNLADFFQIEGGVARLSPVLSASSSRLTAKLAGKMNVLRGFDVVPGIGHHRAGHLGNYADSNSNLNGELGIAHQPTIDQLMAWSSAFYSMDALTSVIKERSIHVGVDWGDGNMSWSYSDPLHRQGKVVPLGVRFNSVELFNAVFAPPPTSNGRPLIADLVLENYKSMRDGNRRLSAADRQRLNDHVERLHELQRKLTVTAKPLGPKPTESSHDVVASDPGTFGFDPERQKKAWQLTNDVVVAVLEADASRIVTMRVGDTDRFSTTTKDWHQAIAHQAWRQDDPEPQQLLRDSRQRIFEDVFLDLMAKLDALPDGDGTVLDHTLMQFTQESGPSPHQSTELPIITAGSAGGFLKTGLYCDYRDLTQKASSDASDSVEAYHGLVYNQWLGTALQAMGLPPSEYESGSYGGYGAVNTKNPDGTSDTVHTAALTKMSEVVPFLKA